MDLCSIEGCKYKVRARGLCMTHWRHVKATGNPFLTLRTKLAQENWKIKCLIPICTNGARAKGYCRSHYVRNRTLEFRYQITLLDYLEMIEKNEGKCDICGRFVDTSIENNLYLDHNHTTNQMR